MKRLYPRALLSLTLVLFSSLLYADDTEIFFNIEQDVARPNILFFLDNSGSMDTKVQVQSADFDPSVNYSGDYSSNYVYFQNNNKLYTIKKSLIECPDLFSKLGSIGKTAPYRMSYYYQNRWNSLDDFNINNSRTECQADSSSNIKWNKMEAFSFYSANYLNWYFNHRGTTTMTRLEIVQKVTNDLVDGLEGVNIGLMTFNPKNYSEGGIVVVPVENVDDNRDTFKQTVNNLYPTTNTPIAESLFGAKRYFEGGDPFLNSSYYQADGAFENGHYKSPISLECQANYVVLLTDGEPTQDGNHNDYMENELGIKDCSGNCLDEISGYMHNNDLSSKYDGRQNAIINTIGFQTDQQLLSDAATKGGGSYYLADNVDNLEEVFYKIIKEVLTTNTTYSSPGVSVNNFNQLTHLDALYYSVFEPVVEPYWPGNLKRYRLKSDGTIVDQNGNDAIDDSTGFFKDTSKSYWSASVDGAKAASGGLASKLPADNSQRKVYTYYDSSQSKDLTASVNAVTTANTSNLTKAMFGDASMSDARLQKLINWTRGQDVTDVDKDDNTTEGRQTIGDPLHSQPNLQVYGGTEDDPDTTVFFGDNQGFIHAVDGETGSLYFSFIPAELLANQGILMDNQVAETQRPYGMDGSIVSWFNDIDNNLLVNDEDTVYIYSGMRRGGRSYYALDVTDRSNPKVLWTIHGGSGSFSELGQSWSNPVKKRVRIGSDIKDVLFFSGGYDPQQDSVGVRTQDSMGRAIYMVDAKTGALLWWAGPTDSGANLELAQLDYSIPATPAVIDVNGDGLSDQLYVGDMGGQLWRFDFTNGNAANSFATGGVILNVAGDTAASNRRFYHTPDISGTLTGGARFLNVAIGSGYQAHPLDKDVDDRFYKLTISSIGTPKNEDGDVEYQTLSESDLFDTTENLIQQGTQDEKDDAEASLDDAKGWFIRLTRDGEKVLSTSTTLRGDVYFTTYEPSGNLDPCVPAAGQSRLYHVKLRDGRAVVNYDGLGEEDELTAPDREVTLQTIGLPPSPKTITIDGKEIIVAGTETLLPPDPSTLADKIYWYEE